jgi:hypothetical protein
VAALRALLRPVLEAAGPFWAALLDKYAAAVSSLSLRALTHVLCRRIVSFGPRHCGANILVAAPAALRFMAALPDDSDRLRAEGMRQEARVWPCLTVLSV